MAARILKKGIDDYRWFQFRWDLWIGSPELQACSAAARGWWLEMCGVMFTYGEPRGVMRNDLVAFAKQVRHLDKLAEIRACVKELEREGVFSRGRDVIAASPRDLSAWLRDDDIVCRHMFREWLTKSLRSAAGRKGGAASAESRWGNGAGVRDAKKVDLSKRSARGNDGISKQSGDLPNVYAGAGDIGGKQVLTNGQATLSLDSRSKQKKILDKNKSNLGYEGSARGGELQPVGESVQRLKAYFASLNEAVEDAAATFPARMGLQVRSVCGATDAQTAWFEEVSARMDEAGRAVLLEALDFVGLRDGRRSDAGRLKNPMGVVLKRVYAWARDAKVEVSKCPGGEGVA